MGNQAVEWHRSVIVVQFSTFVNANANNCVQYSLQQCVYFFNHICIVDYNGKQTAGDCCLGPRQPKASEL